MDVIVLSNPLSVHLLSILRDEKTGTKEFRRTLAALSSIIFIKSSEDIDTEVIKVKTPFEYAMCAQLSEKIVFVPILRAGLAMLSNILEIFPDAIVEHLGIYRDEKTLKPEPYYSSLDDKVENSVVFILDPMLATGGTISYAVEKIAQYKPARIKILSVVAAPEGIERVSKTVDKMDIDVKLCVSAIDRTLNTNGYIIPGLGDAGDRAFGTQ